MDGYQKFLGLKPVMAEAAERLSSDDDFAGFLRQVFQTPSMPGSEQGLAWFLFEEIGKPEWRAYFQDALLGERAPDFRKSNGLHALRDQAKIIAPRLDIRRKQWKTPKQQDFIEAHSQLLEILNQFMAESTV